MSSEYSSNGAPKAPEHFDELKDPDAADTSVSFGDEEIENTVVSALLKEPALLDYARGRLKPTNFINGANQKIVTLALSLVETAGGLPSPELFDAEFNASVKGLRDEAYCRGRLQTCRYGTEPTLYDRATLRSLIDRLVKRSIVRKGTLDLLEHQKTGKGDLRKILDSFQGLLKAPSDDHSDDALLDGAAIWAKADDLRKERNWIVENWIKAGKVGLFFGREKRGKSTAVFSMVSSLISGCDWFGNVVTQSPVLLVDYENEEDYMRDNFEPMLSACGGDLAQAQKFLFCIDSAKIRKVCAPFDAPYVIQQIKRIVERTGTAHGLVVIDTARGAFSGLYPGQPNWEWSTQTVRDAIELARVVIAETGWAVLVLHHSTKATGEASGSGDWGGACDYEIKYERKEHNPTAKLTWIGRQLEPPAPLEFTKQGKILVSASTLHPDEAVQLRMWVESFVPVGVENRKPISKILEEIAAHKDCTLGKHRLRELLNAMVANDQIQHQLGSHNATEVWRG